MNEHRQQKIQHLQQQLAAAGMACSTPGKTTASDKLHRYQPMACDGLPLGFPTDVLQQTVLNEVAATTHGDISIYGFALLALHNLAITTSKEVLWCTPTRQSLEVGQLFAPGLTAIDTDPAQIIQLEARRTIDVLWAMEEAARSGALKAVIGTIDNLTFTQSRRLSLAAIQGQTPIFMLRPHGFNGASTAFSRWRVSSKPGQVNMFNPRAPGQATIEVALCQCRNGRKGKWICHYEPEKQNKTHHLPVVATTGDRTPLSPHRQHPVRKRAG